MLKVEETLSIDSAEEAEVAKGKGSPHMQTHRLQEALAASNNHTPPRVDALGG